MTSPAAKPSADAPALHGPYPALLHRPLNQLLLIGPLLILFHAGSAWLGHSLLVPDYLQVVLLWFGGRADFLPALLIVAVLLGQHVVRRDPLKPSGLAVMGMLLESALWTVPLVALGWLTSRIAAQAATAPAKSPLLRGLVESIGAGVYEEFLFRLVFISLVGLIGVDLLNLKRRGVMIGAMIASGLVFAAVHFPLSAWASPAELPWGQVVFLAVVGMWWAVLFAWRGLGVAVASHIWWDVLVTLMR